MSSHHRSIVDDIAERLRCSPDSRLQQSTFLGFHHGGAEYPILLADGLWESGFWVLGAARSGKTQRVLASLILQRLWRNDCPICILDCKGDDALFQKTRQECERLGREFWVLTNVPQFSTRLFNPLDQRHLARLSPAAVTEIVLTSLNLFNGFDYGPYYFYQVSSEAFSTALVMRDSRGTWEPQSGPTRARSFLQIAKRMPQIIRLRPELKDAEAIVMTMRKLSREFLFNPGCGDVHPAAAVRGAIQLEDLLHKGPNGTYPVLYCYLRAESEPVTSSISAKLVLNLVKNAQRQLRDRIQQGLVPGPAPVLPTFIDECQVVMDDALRNMLEQGASLGIQFVLANQDISQLQRGARDYFPTVWENCGNKIILTSRDDRFQQLLMKLSGEKMTQHLSYEIGGHDLGRGRVTTEYSTDGLYQVREMVSPRMERNHVLEMSAAPGRALFIPSQDEALTQYRGFPILTDIPFASSQKSFEAYKTMSWPAPTPDTVVPYEFFDQWQEFLAKQFDA